MKQCTIYTSTKSVQEIVEAIKHEFNDKKVEVFNNGYQIRVTFKKLFSSYSINFSLMTAESESTRYKDMMNGMYGYFYQIPTKHQSIKEKLLKQIQYLNACVGIVSDREIDNDSYQRIVNILSKLNALLFVPSGSILDKYGKVILDQNGESQVEDYIVTASSDILDKHVETTKSAEERKKRSIELLKSRNIPYIEHLPVIVGDEHARIREKEEIAKRAIALALIATYAADLASGKSIEESRSFLKSLIERYNAETFFTERELEFINSDIIDEEKSIQFAWEYECLLVLLWALGYVKELDFPNKICDLSEIIGYIKDAKNFEEFLVSSNLRKKHEILDEADLIYRYDWACVDARIKNLPAPGGLDDEVVVERHKALNWLICYFDQEWDDVRTDT
ncbi:DUF4272 domain-containing protein [Acetivibrio clariflavus]|uniref:DUF4272 domain-containing protein n=1 Tax=Acetivibrio clariflavus (strain DSM 19732 / NBRC 101661 / EBR45) TaxID=720554 RepID=G8LVA6_ACECE|nr:DUF4272 domain-containing protein [Acetivibrio clariflavus]AEV67460.1 hypothetical protein Clocl_0760 [Acetivibrio clariflavus DSM 19732]HPU41846.1 DUF4272 domain-containing protein [Acetivibrio clariflavus]